MSRIYANEDGSEAQAALWQSNLRRQIKSKRGQAFLRELLAALEALPEKRLITNAIAQDGCTCTLGALALKRRVDSGESREVVLADLATIVVDQEHEDFAGEEMNEWAEAVLSAPSMLAWVIPYETDDYDITIREDGRYKGRRAATPEELYEHMVRWVRARIVDGGAAA